MERLIVGITGATGIQYGLRVLQLLKECPVETHLVVSRSAELVMAYETDFSKEALSALATVVHPVEDMGASIASGSFKTCGMLIAPCSMKTLSEIASGVTSSLLTRAADVVLKERRRLVLMARETPLHLGHLRNMLAVTEMGGELLCLLSPLFIPGRLLWMRLFLIQWSGLWICLVLIVRCPGGRNNKR